jgi:hypothetical protein
MKGIRKDCGVPPAGETLDVDGLLASGWINRDVPWCSLQAWAQLFDVLGTGEYHVLACTQVGPSMRGQVLMSPKAIEHLRMYAAAFPHAASAPLAEEKDTK